MNSVTSTTAKDSRSLAAFTSSAADSTAYLLEYGQQYQIYMSAISNLKKSFTIILLSIQLEKKAGRGKKAQF